MKALPLILVLSFSFVNNFFHKDFYSFDSEYEISYDGVIDFKTFTFTSSIMYGKISTSYVDERGDTAEKELSRECKFIEFIIDDIFNIIDDLPGANNCQKLVKQVRDKIGNAEPIGACDILLSSLNDGCPIKKEIIVLRQVAKSANNHYNTYCTISYSDFRQELSKASVGILTVTDEILEMGESGKCQCR